MGQPNPSSPLPRRTTAIFAKRPVAGRVKTRLCPPLEPAQAARLAEAMLLDLVERLAPSDSYRTVLAYSPPESADWFASTFPSVRDQRAQVGEGLAERMLHYFFVELAGTVGSTAVAVGSDAPLLDPAIVIEAHDRLQAGADLVLGPDAGGGYYLIGMKDAHRALFEEIEMSTGDMREKTLEVASKLKLKVELLKDLYDIDVARDLDRLRADLATMSADERTYPARSAACLDQLIREDS